MLVAGFGFSEEELKNSFAGELLNELNNVFNNGKKDTNIDIQEELKKAFYKMGSNGTNKPCDNKPCTNNSCGCAEKASAEKANADKEHNKKAERYNDADAMFLDHYKVFLEILEDDLLLLKTQYKKLQKLTNDNDIDPASKEASKLRGDIMFAIDRNYISCVKEDLGEFKCAYNNWLHVADWDITDSKD